MKTGFLIFSCLLLITGCRNKGRVPSNIIPPPKMQAILWDMMRADQFLVDFVLPKDSSLNKIAESQKLYQNIFGIYQINKEQFQRSFSYYKSKPALFIAIMDSLSKPITEAPTKLAEPYDMKDSSQTIQQKLPVGDTMPGLRRKKVLMVN
jgi:hypothetical protein